MADEPINPGGGAAVADAPAAPAVDAGAVAAPDISAAAPEVSGPNEGESTSQFIQRASKPAPKAADAVVDPAAPVDADKQATEKKAEEDRVADEQKVAEEKAAADKLAAEKKPESSVEEEQEFVLEPTGPLPPKDLAAKLKENPELDAALDKAGLKAPMYEAARLAQQVSGFKEVFPDVESAKYAAQTSQEFGMLAESFNKISDVKSTASFLSALMPLTYVLDEEGNPKLGADNQPISDGSVGKFMDNAIGLALDSLVKRAEKENDEDLLSAVEMIKERTGRGPSSAAQESLTEEQKAKQAELDAREAKVKEEQVTREQQKEQEFELNVQKDIESDVDKLLDKILDKAELGGFNQKYLRDDIKEGIFAKVAARKDFFLQMDALMRRPMSEKVRKERVALATRTIKSLYEPVVREKMIAAGVKLKQQQADQSKNQAAREAQSRSEVHGAARPAQPQQMPTDDQLYSEAEKELTKENNRSPNSGEIFLRVSQKKAKLTAR